jgi:hypothetical protein
LLGTCHTLASMMMGMKIVSLWTELQQQLLSFVDFGNKVPLCIPGWPQTCDPPVPIPRVLGFQAGATVPLTCKWAQPPTRLFH